MKKKKRRWNNIIIEVSVMSCVVLARMATESSSQLYGLIVIFLIWLIAMVTVNAKKERRDRNEKIREVV